MKCTDCGKDLNCKGLNDKNWHAYCMECGTKHLFQEINRIYPNNKETESK